MTRKKLPLAIAALTAGMFGSGVVHALGLGEIKLYSHLNEPLQAEVGLVEVGDLNADEIITKLATKEAFDKAGIDREYFLTQIKFEVVVQPDGRGVLKLSTEKATSEPFLDFILDASWPNGHVLKQYTLLLDPPTYTAEGAAPTVSKQEEVTPVVQQPEVAVQQAPAESQAPVVAPAPAQPVIPAGTEHYTTQRNDTLWRIASTHQAGGASIAQTMDAIHRLNPNAFIKNNHNLLKTDKTLRLPSAEEVAFLVQGGSVEQLLSAQRISAQAPQLSTEQTAASASNIASEDQLKIVGTSTANSSTGAGTSESIDKIDRDNQDMNARLAELTAQIQTMQQLIKMQDDQLSSLQQQLGGSPQKAEMKEAVEKLKSELSKVETEINKEPTAVPAATTMPDATTTTVPAAPVEGTATTQPTTAPVVTQAPVTKPAEQPMAKKPVETTPPAAPVEKESGSMWVVLLGLLFGVGAAAAVFGKKFIDKRKAQTQADKESDWSVDALRHEPSLASAMDDESGEALQEIETSTEHETEHTFDAPEQTQQSKVELDPLEEANEQIANGNPSGAINVLKQAISQQATRLDLRTRLLELSAQIGDIETFEAQESYISRWGGAAAKQLAITLRQNINSSLSAVKNEVELDFDIESTSALVEPVAQTSQEDELVSLEHLFDDTPSTKVEETKVELSDELAALDHLFDDTSSTKVEETKVELSDELAALDHLFEDAPAEASANVMLEPETVMLESEGQEPVESSDVGNELAALDHLFDDLPTEETKKADEIEFDLSDFNAPDTMTEPETQIETETESEVDFAAELGLLDDEVTTPTVAEPEFEINLAPQEEPVAAVESAQEQVSTSATGGEDDEFGFLAGTDEAATKLDLAKAYIDMEDIDGAKDILQEVLQEGNAAQQQEAKDLLARL